MKRVRSSRRAPITVPVAFVNGMLGGVRSRGEPCDIYLEDAGIAVELLAQPGSRVTAEQFVGLFVSLAVRRDDDVLGFLSRPLRRGSLAMIVRAGVSGGTLDVAMRRAVRAFSLLQDDVALQLVADGPQVGWALRFRETAVAPPNFLHELVLRFFWRLLAWMAGGRLPATRFDFAYPSPAYQADYGPIFPSQHRFNCTRSALWLNVRHLQQPVRRDEAAVRTFISNAPGNIIVPRREMDAVSTRLRVYLQAEQPRWPGLSACADALHMSPATLQRHLAKDGASFQSLKDELRRDLAIHRLNTSKVPLTTLAAELGFSDGASFQRAFKKWTGSAPGPYRKGSPR